MILLVLGIYFRLVSTSTAIDDLPANATTIKIRKYNRDYLQMEKLAAVNETGQVLPISFESVFNKLTSTSSLTALFEPAVTTKKSRTTDFEDEPVKVTDYLLRIDGTNVPISVSDGNDVSNSSTSARRARRQVSEEKLDLPRWPGMPQGVLRQGAPHSEKVVKNKILSLMLQSMYSVQEWLWPMGPLVARYEHLTPYRMAFIFMKLDQLVHECHSILMYTERNHKVDITMTKRLQLYSQLMRRNIDITYLVDYISSRVPRDQEVRLRQFVIRKEQEKLMSQWNDYQYTSQHPSERPVQKCTKIGGCGR